MGKKKGDRRERQAADIYREAGFAVERATSGGFQSADFFDLFDLLAFDYETGRFRGVQVKSNLATGIEGFHLDAQPFIRAEEVDVDYAVCHDNRGWRLIAIEPDGPQLLVDEREQDCNMREGAVECLRSEREGAADG